MSQWPVIGGGASVIVFCSFGFLFWVLLDASGCILLLLVAFGCFGVLRIVFCCFGLLLVAFCVFWLLLAAVGCF